MGKLEVVVGGQFGSEGKGAVGAELARRAHDDEVPYAAVRVAGPNAGHSAYDAQGRKWALRQIPVAGVANPYCALVIGAGSEVDEQVLREEVAALDHAGLQVSERLWVDQSATVIEGRHKQAEAEFDLNGRLGSTAKGIGAARADRAMRQAVLYGGDDVDTTALIRRHLADGGTVMIEGTQGYGLGQHAGFYPQCTSSDCRAIDFLSMAGVSPWDPHVDHLDVWVVLRTHPIRVAGNSGPLSGEMSWDELTERSRGYIQPEQTTVTKKTRRVGAWDAQLARAAVLANGGGACKVALTFFDYWFPELAGATSQAVLEPRHWEMIEQVQDEAGAPVHLLGTGPNSMVWV